MEHPNLNSSVTSESPDIGNWFASYKYESPAIDSGSFRHGFDSGESEREKDGRGSCGFKEIGTKGGVFVHGKLDSDGHKSVAQISGVSELPSSLSEPKDIKNWFSSYVYESPSLEETTGFGNENGTRKDEEELKSLSIKNNISKKVLSEKEQSDGLSNCDGSWRVTKQARQPVRESERTIRSLKVYENPRYCNELDKNFLQAPDPLESPSILSEPSNIKNWFSSYVYEPPSLDTYDNFGDSVGKESKCEKDGYRVEIGKTDNEEDLGEFRKSSMVEDLVDEKKVSVGLAGCDGSFWRNTKHDRQPAHEVPDPLDSSSHLSEPTDIRNWFSSYVYESPSLDPADGVGDLVFRERIDVEDELSVENTNGEMGKNSRGFSKKKSNGEEVDVKQVQSEEYIEVNTHCRLSKQETEPVSVVDKTTRIDENQSYRSDFPPKYIPKGMQLSQAEHFTPSNYHRSSCSNDAKWPQDLFHSEGSILQESSEANVNAEKCSIPKNNSESTHGSKEHEDGFITTRKRKCTARNDKNSSTVAPLCGKEVVIERRKVLGETTNYHHSPATMISGKWKCPQQRKPNLGPPMKQLGLGNWFRKS